MPLSLTREINERVLIRPVGGPDIWVRVTRSTRTGARIEIDAPRSVEIVREELLPDAKAPTLIPAPEGE